MKARFTDEQEPLQRLAGKIHLIGIRFPEESFIAIGHHTNHEAVLFDPAAHMTVEHKAQPAEHALFFDILSALEVAPDSFR